MKYTEILASSLILIQHKTKRKVTFMKNTKKTLVLLLALIMTLSFAACGGTQPTGEKGETSGSGDENVLTFSVPTEGEPPVVKNGVNVTNVVPEGCTKLVYYEEVHFFEMPSDVEAEMFINYFNETIMPEVEAIADDGKCLTKDRNAGSDPLGIGAGTTVYRSFDSVGYKISEDGSVYVYDMADGEAVDYGRSLNSICLLETRYVYGGVLYHLIISVDEADTKNIKLVLYEEHSQNFEITD